MLLHPFDTDAGRTISPWVFHDIGKGRYGWYASTSNDRGATARKTWTIDAVRKRPHGDDDVAADAAV